MSSVAYLEVSDLAKKIEDNGRDKYATYGVRKNAKIRGYYDDDLCANYKMENKGRQE